MRTTRRNQRPSQCGQALIETSLVVMIILLVFVGVYATAVLANDQNTATSAVRAGGRFAAQLGNGGYPIQTPSKNPQTIDNEIAKEVCGIAVTMPDVDTTGSHFITVTIYRPGGNADGSQSVNDPSDTYTTDKSCNISLPGTLANTCAVGSTGFTLDCRTQLHPSEASLGVRLQYWYKSPTPFFPILAQMSAYTVVVLSPVFA